MEVICLQDEAFYSLIEQVVERLKKDHGEAEDKWIDDKTAMRKLNVKRTTLQTLRDEGKIRFSQPSRKVILYDRESIDEYHEKHAKNPFK